MTYFSRVRVLGLCVGYALLAACADNTNEGPSTNADFELKAAGRPVGSACAWSTQCNSGLCSADVASGQCGVCLERRLLGETCGAALTGCSASANCHNGICVSAKITLGEPCALQPKGGDIGQCDDELFCAIVAAAGTPGLPSGQCTPRTTLGQVCFDTDPEGIDDSPTRPGAPSALVLGQRCGLADGTFLSFDCPEGAGCGDPRFPNGGGGTDSVSVCLPLPVEGEVCMIDSCAKGLFCSEQTTNSSGVIPKRCEKLRSRGQACDTQFLFNKDCEPGLECRSQVCQDPCR